MAEAFRIGEPPPLRLLRPWCRLLLLLLLLLQPSPSPSASSSPSREEEEKVEAAEEEMHPRPEKPARGAEEGEATEEPRLRSAAVCGGGSGQGGSDFAADDDAILLLAPLRLPVAPAAFRSSEDRDDSNEAPD